MDHPASPEPEAPARLSPEQARQLVLRTVAQEADALLRTAFRYSLCDDDAHDAYQRGMEIFMRRAETLDPARAARWLHVVVMREAQALYRSRTAQVALEDLDYELLEAVHVSAPEERVLNAERHTRAAEALHRLKPDELRAVWLKALGKSYGEIARETSWSPTKVNRCLVEGRRRLVERLAGIESGAECERCRPLLSALVAGKATPAQLTDLRPHLRYCAGCRATVRALHGGERPLVVGMPLGLVGLGAKLAGWLDRAVPAVGGSEAAAAGGAGVLGAGVGGAKLAAVLAAGAVAVGGGGAAVVGPQHPTPAPQRAALARPVARPPAPAAGRAPMGAAMRPARTGSPAAPATTPSRPRRAVRAAAGDGRARAELTPGGREVAAVRPPDRAAAAAAAAPRRAAADASVGEFAPQP